MFRPKTEYYTMPEISNLAPGYIMSDIYTDQATTYYNMMIKDVKNESFMSELNTMLARIPGTTPYTSDDQIKQMFSAALNGEKNLSDTDKCSLRLFSSIPFLMNKVLLGLQSRGFPPLTWNQDGTVAWSQEILGGKTDVKTNLLNVMQLASIPIDSPDFIPGVNMILPKGMTPFKDLNDYKNSITTPLDDRNIFVLKYISVGLMYIVWMAENKWKLDPNWVMPGQKNVDAFGFI